MPITVIPQYGSQKRREDKRADIASVQMPHVFVVPPEEDEAPTWCCFDAANPALSQVIEQPETPEISVLAFPSDDEDPLEYRRQSVVMPRRDDETQSVVDALLYDEPDNEYETDSEISNEPEQDPHSIQESDRHETSKSTRDAANDSDVIEVVKVRRKTYPLQAAEQGQDVAAAAPSQQKARSQTLKSRASKAFQSLRGSLRSRPRAQDVFPSSSSSTSSTHTARTSGEQAFQEAPPPHARPPGVTRRGSRILSQLFTAPSLKSQTSMASFEEPLASPTQPSLPSSNQSSATQNFQSVSRQSSLYDDPSSQEQARLQAASPAPTTASRSSTRRFSRLNLQKIFSFSSSSSSSSPSSPPAPEPEPSSAPMSFDEPPDSTAASTLRSITSTPASSSISTTSGPQTPTSSEGPIPVRLVGKDDHIIINTPAAAAADLPVFDSLDSMFDTNGGLNLGLGLGLKNLDSANDDDDSDVRQNTPTPRKSSSSSVWDSITPRRLGKFRASSHPLDEVDDADTSLEMRLDSLHFDSISFDADQFI